jgi:hypothetical protein
MEKKITGINYNQFLDELKKKVAASQYKAALPVNNATRVQIPSATPIVNQKYFLIF